MEEQSVPLAVNTIRTVVPDGGTPLRELEGHARLVEKGCAQMALPVD